MSGESTNLWLKVAHTIHLAADIRMHVCATWQAFTLIVVCAGQRGFWFVGRHLAVSPLGSRKIAWRTAARATTSLATKLSYAPKEEKCNINFLI